MKWGMVIDVSKCIRCYSCMIACRVAHFSPMGVSWPRLMALDKEFALTYPVRCNQCQNASCVEVCPTGATQQRKDGIVSIDQNKCVGCRYCVIACPYQNRIFVSGDKDKGYFPGQGLTDFEKAGKKLYPHQVGTTGKCNFCVERIDAGLARGLRPGIDRESTPACVNACQARVMTFGDLDDPESDISKLIRQKGGFRLHPEYGTEPSIYYIDKTIGTLNSQMDSMETNTEPLLKGLR
jgi:phenylacetyl-CoA:acceptor oxidoreductase subunit 1